MKLVTSKDTCLFLKAFHHMIPPIKIGLNQQSLVSKKLFKRAPIFVKVITSNIYSKL